MAINDKRQRSLRAMYMRGGTSKGVFIDRRDLPPEALEDPAILDRLLLRIMGSPDRYRNQIDGLGAATPSTSKVVIVSPCARSDSDVAYRFGAVSVDKPVVDWGNNCGNLTAAVALFAIHAGIIPVPPDGMAAIRLWQENIGQNIVARFPVEYGAPVETGEFILDGVAFASSEVQLEFLDSGEGSIFPTNQVSQPIAVPGWGQFTVSLVDAGAPTVFIHAHALRLQGTELQSEFEQGEGKRDMLEAIRAQAAVEMGIAKTPDEATRDFPHTPRLAFVAPPQSYLTSAAEQVDSKDIDLLVRILSLGKLHHAMTGTGAVALAAAAAVPGTVVSGVMAEAARAEVRFGHPSGTLKVGARLAHTNGKWCARSVVMSRSARRLMAGEVFYPAEVLGQSDAVAASLVAAELLR